MKYLVLMLLVCGLLPMAGAQETPAAAADEAVQLEDVTVTASREERSTATVPAKVTVITRHDIERSAARDVTDLLRNLAGVNVLDLFGNSANGTVVDVGGFGETGALNNVVLVDGLRSDFGDLSPVVWTSIPLNQIERIEVVRGGNSTLHGGNATGGVINIITRAGGNNQAKVGGQVDTFGYRQTLSLSGQLDALGYNLSESYIDGDGYRENNNYRSKALHLGLSFVPAESFWELEFRAGINEEDFGLPGGLTSAQLASGFDRDDAANEDDWAERTTSYVTVSPTWHLNDEVRLEVPMTYRERRARFFYNSFFPPFQNFEYRDLKLGTVPQLVSEMPLFGRENTLVLGFDLYSVEKNNLDNNPESRLKTLDVFINDTFEVVDDVYVDLGYRRGRAEYDWRGDLSRNEDLDAAHAGVTWNYRPGSKVFLSYDRSYRAGAIDEYYSFFTATINPDLEPQITKTAQLGIEHRFNDRFTASATGFLVDTDQEIFYDPALFTNVNYDETRRIGLILDARAALCDHADVFVSYTFTDAELGDNAGTIGNYDGNRVPLVPRHMVKGGAEVRFLDSFTWNVLARWVDSRHLAGDWNNNQDELDSYVVVDTKLSYQWKWLGLHAGINNVFDKEYNESGFFSPGFPPFFPDVLGYYPMPERSFFAGADLTFTF